MSCAKKKVTCFIFSIEGESFTGTNDCSNPQSSCPRASGEGYDKCKSICEQEGHAEIMALKAAGDKARGGVAYLFGIDYYCPDCQKALFEAGVLALRAPMQKPL